MKRISMVGLCLAASIMLIGCKDNEVKDDDHGTPVEAITYDDLDTNESNPLPEGNYSNTYFLYSIEESLGENDSVEMCFSFGELSLEEYTKKSQEDDTKELAHKACLPFSEDNPNLIVNGGTGVKIPTVKVTGKEGAEPVYEITM